MDMLINGDDIFILKAIRRVDSTENSIVWSMEIKIVEMSNEFYFHANVNYIATALSHTVTLKSRVSSFFGLEAGMLSGEIHVRLQL